MKKLFLVISFILSQSTFAQNTFKAKVTDVENKQVLIGATAFIDTLQSGASSETAGLIVINNIPNGKYQILFYFIGYNELKSEFQFPLTNPNQLFQIKLESNASELSEIIVQSTRTNSHIEEIPIRVEVIGGDELKEKDDMRPSNISMLLSESTGIQSQQTSAVNGNVSIRLLGLDSKYTQILKDGFPLYGGFAQGLSIILIPPPDRVNNHY